jgi:hypothetical protein
MKLIKPSIFIASVLILGACAKPQNPPFAQAIVNQIISPSYQLLSTQTAQFSQAAADVCADNTINEKELQLLRHDWLLAMSAWQQTAVFKFGPIEQHNLRWQFQFWPDKHNLNAKKVKALLTQETLITPADINNAGVVVQGFSAIEYVLFDKVNTPAIFATSGLPAEQRCNYLRLTTQKLAESSALLNKAWLKDGAYYAVFASPKPENKDFPDQSVNIAVMLDSLVTELETIKVDKLANPLGLKATKGKPNVYTSEAWRSTQSLSLIRSNMLTIERVLTLPKVGLLEQLPKENDELANTIRQQLADVKKQLQRIDISLNESLKSGNGLAAVKDLHNSVEVLLVSCKNLLPKALGVTLSFNGKDGD